MHKLKLLSHIVHRPLTARIWRCDLAKPKRLRTLSHYIRKRGFTRRWMKVYKYIDVCEVADSFKIDIMSIVTNFYYR